jgi:hypothetical protein
MILFHILSLIFMYGIFKHNQTYKHKERVSIGSANQRAKVVGAREEAEQGPVACRWVDQPSPHLDFYVIRH